ncbi:hypothetical protein OSSY52_17730 [Tepiditoga spiralis]|uniref:RNA polymerase sigma factor 54 DNA-binding domain-containing protein n=1 Tax=Tepiditoga spiralis TaxID=2108365 RepID=A0A7G1GBA3_9BACT|nr:hypothetical protein [Tepiditoga spiralis]BBE31632.1 hypothetical protein OSSY52_17730 [Tepiditoga spiralis]
MKLRFLTTQKIKQKLNLTQKQIRLINLLQKDFMELEKTVDDFINENAFINFKSYDEVYIPQSKIEYIYENIKEPEDVLSEIKLIFLSIVEKKYEDSAEALTSYIDSNGVLKVDKNDFIKEFNLSKKEYENLLNTLKRLGPTGFCEETLEKALILREKNNENGTPLGSYSSSARYLTKKVDIYFFIVNNELKYEIEEPNLPSLNKDYLESLKKTNDSKVIKYINNEIERYNELNSLLKKRRELCNSIANLLIKTNYNFIKKKEKIIPLGIRDTAKKFEMSASTISRFVNTKGVQLPDGLNVPLNIFFNTKDTQKNEKEKVVNFIKEHMKTSDQKLSEMIKKELNIKISRRTVNKYKNEIKKEK